jgi:hypothetical protein
MTKKNYTKLNEKKCNLNTLIGHFEISRSTQNEAWVSSFAKPHIHTKE